MYELLIAMCNENVLSFSHTNFRISAVYFFLPELPSNGYSSADDRKKAFAALYTFGFLIFS